MEFMVSPKFVCGICSKSFSRRWNAQRHNDSLHYGMSCIDTKYIADNKENVFTNFNTHYPSTKATESSGFGISKHKPQTNTFRKHLFNPLDPFRKKPNNSFKFMNEDEKEQILYNTLEKMASPLEKLEKLLKEKTHVNVPYHEIDRILSNQILMALQMPNPVKVLQDLYTYYNRLYYSNKMILLVANSHNIDALTATEMMKTILLIKYM